MNVLLWYLTCSKGLGGDTGGDTDYRHLLAWAWLFGHLHLCILVLFSGYEGRMPPHCLLYRCTWLESGGQLFVTATSANPRVAARLKVSWRGNKVLQLFNHRRVAEKCAWDSLRPGARFNDFFILLFFNSHATLTRLTGCRDITAAVPVFGLVLETKESWLFYLLKAACQNRSISLKQGFHKLMETWNSFCGRLVKMWL